MQLYRFLSDDDTAAFCHKVSAALSQGWALYGSPTYALDASRGVMRCGQAVVKDIEGRYQPGMSLAEA